MNEPEDRLEILWDGLLSRQDERVRAAFASLNTSEQQAVLAHLQRMSSEAGWHLEQRISAEAALRALHQEDEGTQNI
jgi:hypothetical protein